jgi:hypothetical protein
MSSRQYGAASGSTLHQRGGGAEYDFLVFEARLSRLDELCDGSPAVAGYPDPATLHAVVQLPAPAVLLQEGVERGE